MHTSTASSPAPATSPLSATRRELIDEANGYRRAASSSRSAGDLAAAEMYIDLAESAETEAASV